ncbi:unnamed protein product, partial [Ectocarpus sp. 12 AP-2014]
MSLSRLEAEIGDGTAAVKATPGVDGMAVKEEEHEEQQHEEEARPGKRKFGGIAQALRRHTGWTAGSPHAESTTRGPSKRQRKDSTSRTNE